MTGPLSDEKGPRAPSRGGLRASSTRKSARPQDKEPSPRTNPPKNRERNGPMARYPTLFISHGAPTFAIRPGVAGPLLQHVGANLPPPRAILILSPHWMTTGITLSSHPHPVTLHDFSGFPQELSTLTYPAPGAPTFAEDVRHLLAHHSLPAALDAERGLDHGAWVPLRYLFPAAHIPVVQLSLPQAYSATELSRLGNALSGLADDEVLLVGSGSLTHNLQDAWRSQGAEVAPYAERFVDWVRGLLQARDLGRLLAWQSHPDARRAHPSADHFLPLVFAAFAADPHFSLEILAGGIEYGALSMESYVFSPPARPDPHAIPS